MELPSRYLIGIDLGTTNSAIAYIDRQDVTHGDVPRITIFDVLQLVAPGAVEQQPTLPSFLYFVNPHDRQAGSLALPWDKQPAYVVGVLAREHGALAPGQLVASAKSWLCHREVDRTAPLLPWGSDRPEQACSPVEASSQYLAHLREAWNHVFVSQTGEAARFERQEIVLTVPASFDAEARDLTVQAARDAGIERLTLLEEPQAAFYAWSTTHYRTLSQDLADGHVVLVCDVGGGTTDFSLIRVQISAGEVRLERTAIGEHLLLGGDNVDLALARHLETKLGSPQLTLRQRQALRRQSCAAKERLLSAPDLERVSIRLLGSGSSVVGGTLSVDLTHHEVMTILLDGFLPAVRRHEVYRHDRRVGLRELGLPYANEPAITRHLARFLRSAAPQSDMVCPDAILFNGGFFAPSLTRERLVDVIASWFPEQGLHWRPQVLHQDALATAVARGAVYYGYVRHAGGLRIGGGSARAYYIGVQADTDDPETKGQAVCVMPRGTEEGTELSLPDRVLTALTNRPVAFTLYSSTSRRDAHGDVVRLNEDEVHMHAPLITVLRYGRRSRQIELPVQLTVHYTEVGTLELWCQSQNTEHRWRLQFQLRDAATRETTEASTTPATQTVIAEASLQRAEQLIRAVFGQPQEQRTSGVIAPEALIGTLEATLGYGRDAWPLPTIRQLCDVLLDVAEGRKQGKSFEARWLNLFGFCLRPGFSAALDAWRIEQTRKIYAAGLIYANHLESQIQWLILWRRIAGGLNAGQQRDLYQRHLASVDVMSKKRSKRHNRQVEYETWQLLASLERLAVPARVALGQALLGKVIEHPSNKSYLWSLGRLGARQPFAGPLNCVVPVETAETWLQALLHLPNLTPDVASAIVHIGARTNDSARDISEPLRQEALTTLHAAGFTEPFEQSLREYVPPTRTDAVRIFGESLPEGLRLVDPE